MREGSIGNGKLIGDPVLKTTAKTEKIFVGVFY